MEEYRVVQGFVCPLSIPTSDWQHLVSVVWVDPNRIDDSDFLLKIVDSDLLAGRPLPDSYMVYFTDDRGTLTEAPNRTFPLRVVYQLHYDKRWAKQYPKGYIYFTR